MNRLNKVKNYKFTAWGFLILFAVMFQLGCVQSYSENIEQRGGKERGIHTIIPLFEMLDWVLPRAAKIVPVTTGEIPYAFTATDNFGQVFGVLAGFKTGNGQFTEAEVNQSANVLVPLISDLIRQNLGAGVVSFTPELLRSRWNLTDAQQVHDVVERALLNNLAAYFRVFMEKTEGTDGVNIKATVFAWVPNTLQPGSFLMSIELSESAFNSFFMGF